MSALFSRLQWDLNTTNFGFFNIRQNRLWLPNIYVFNRRFLYDNQDTDFEHKRHAKVFSDGTVEFSLIVKDWIRCDFNNYAFPFDEQLCNVMVYLRSRGRYVGIEEYCRRRTYPKTQDGFSNYSDCVSQIEPKWRRKGNFMAFHHPAGWKVGIGMNDSVDVDEAFSFNFENNSGFGVLYFRLKRLQMTPSVVWVLHPVLISTVAVLGIFFFW